MTEETFFNEIKKILTFNQIPSPTNLTLSQYFDRFKGVSDNDFSKMVDWILENVEYKRFPIMYDFVQAKRAVVHPINEYAPVTRNDRVQAYGPYAKEMDAKFRTMDRIRDLYLRDKINPLTKKPYGKNFQDRTGHSCELMVKLYRSAVEKGKVFDIDSEKWVDIYEGGNTFNPAEMGF